MLILQLSFVGGFTIQLDEPFTLYYSLQPWSEFVDMLPSENNPPGYYILMRGWCQVFGTEAVVVRLPSLIFNGLTAVFMFRFASKYLNTRIAWQACLLFALANVTTKFGFPARAYAMHGFLSVTSMYYFFRYYDGGGEKGNRKTLILLVLFNALNLYTHFMAAVVIGIQGAYALIKATSNIRKFGLYMVGIVATVLLLSPYVPVFLNRVDNSVSQGTWVAPPSGLFDLYSMLRLYLNNPFFVWVFLTMLVASLGLLFSKVKKLEMKRSIGFVLFWWAIGFIGVFVVSFWVPLFNTRYLFFTGPALFLIIGYMSHTISEKIRYKLFQIIIYLIPVAIMGSDFSPLRGHIHSKKEIWAEIQKKQQPKTVTIISPTWLDLELGYYYKGGKYFKLPRVELNEQFAKEKIHFDVNEVVNKDIMNADKLHVVGDYIPDENIWLRTEFVLKKANFAYAEYVRKQE